MSCADSPAASDPDVRLWQAAAAGDQGARQELVERAWRCVAVRLRPFSADARDEIRQAIAESVLRALATGLCPSANLDGFLQWRGRGEITGFLRRDVRNRKMTSLDTILGSAGFDGSPLREVEAAELREIIEECSATIPNGDQRRAWQLRFLQGLEPREIAPRLGVSPEMARVWIARGSRVVRPCIDRKLAARGDRP